MPHQADSPMPKEIRVTEEEEEKYLSKLNNTWLHTHTNYLGEVAETTTVATEEEVAHSHPPREMGGWLNRPQIHGLPARGGILHTQRKAKPP